MLIQKLLLLFLFFLFELKLSLFTPLLFAQHLEPPPARTLEQENYLQQLQKKAIEKKLFEHPAWIALIHYRSTLWGWESEVDSDHFFLSPQGKNNPQAELQSTLASFWGPQCRFLARYAWLKEQLDFDPKFLAEQECPLFEQWLKKISPQSLSLIFSHYFMESTASMFGHSFLRINSKKYGSHPLFSYAINYSAQIKDISSSNPLFYATQGVFGGYPGVFSSAPYYQMVKNYNDVERRDLWEYHLNFSEKEIIQMMRHLWELQENYFDYYFFKENCSYHLLALLEVARPNLELRSQFSWWTTPAETIKLLNSIPQLITGKNYRPSRWSKIQQAYTQFSPEEKKQILQKIEEGLPVNSVNSQESQKSQESLKQAKILDLLNDYYVYQLSFLKEGKQKEDLKKKRSIILQERARLKLRLPDVPQIPQSTPPEQGHDTSRVEISFGKQSSEIGQTSQTEQSTQTDGQQIYLELNIRLSLHDFLSRDQGFFPYSQLEIGEIKLRKYQKEKEVKIHQVTIGSLASLNPEHPLRPSSAWKTHLRWEEDHWNFNFGIGKSYSLAGGAFYALFLLQYNTAAEYRETRQETIGLNLGYIHQFHENWKWHLDYESPKYPANLGKYPKLGERFYTGIAFSPDQNHEIRLQGYRNWEQSEFQLGYSLYY